MPWHIALAITFVLFLLAPFFRKWVDLVVWPKLADWWAGRSRRTLEKQVKRLKRELDNRPTLVSLFLFISRRVLIIFMILSVEVYTLSPLSDQLSPEYKITTNWPQPTGFEREFLKFILTMLFTSPGLVAWVSYHELRRRYRLFEAWSIQEERVKVRIQLLEKTLLQNGIESKSKLPPTG
jgi:hypothetical protein